MDMQGRTLVMIPGEELATLKGTLEKVLAKIKNLQLPKQSPNKESFITAKEFMVAVRIGHTKFDQLVAARKIQTIKKRYKSFVPITEVNKSFSGPNIS